MPQSARGVKPAQGSLDRRREISNLLASGTASDEEVFRRVVKEYKGSVVSFFRLRGFAREECEDLAQETFLNVLRGLHSLRAATSLSAWLASVARGIWLNELRRRSAAKRRALEVSLDDPAVAVEKEGTLQTDDDQFYRELLAKERWQRVRRALETLPERMRQCLLLRLVQELEYQEIATVMRVSIQTVRSQLHDARQRLAEMMEEVERRA